MSAHRRVRPHDLHFGGRIVDALRGLPIGPQHRHRIVGARGLAHSPDGVPATAELVALVVEVRTGNHMGSHGQSNSALTGRLGTSAAVNAELRWVSCIQQGRVGPLDPHGIAVRHALGLCGQARPQGAQSTDRARLKTAAGHHNHRVFLGGNYLRSCADDALQHRLQQGPGEILHTSIGFPHVSLPRLTAAVDSFHWV